MPLSGPSLSRCPGPVRRRVPCHHVPCPQPARPNCKEHGTDGQQTPPNGYTSDGVLGVLGGVQIFTLLGDCERVGGGGGAWGGRPYRRGNCAGWYVPMCALVLMRGRTLSTLPLCLTRTIGGGGGGGRMLVGDSGAAVPVLPGDASARPSPSHSAIPLTVKEVDKAIVHKTWQIRFTPFSDFQNAVRPQAAMRKRKAWPFQPPARRTSHRTGTPVAPHPCWSTHPPGTRHPWPPAQRPNRLAHRPPGTGKSCPAPASHRTLTPGNTAHPVA